MTVIRTPFDRTPAESIELADDGQSGTMWKMIIPMDYKLDYKGRKLHFDRRYLANVRDSFKANALGDQVAYQLADDSNQHDTDEDRKLARNYDPERYRGEVTDLKVVNSGLWAKYNLTKEGLDLIKKNPKLGVSVSLKENFERDGKTYPVVMRHVLGTMSPRIKGMPPWQREEVQLSDDPNEEVLDLTMPDTIEVPKADWDAMKQFMEDQKKFNTELVEALDEDEDDESEETDDSTDLSEDDDEDDPRIIELSTQLAATNAKQKASDDRAAKAEFNRVADSLIRDGVPRALVDLARPFCETSDELEIQLSDGKKGDPREAMLKMLEGCKGYIDMSEEDGHAVSDDESTERDEKMKAIEHDFMLDDF